MSNISDGPWQMNSISAERRGKTGRTSSVREQHGQSPDFLGNGQGNSPVWLQPQVGSRIRLLRMSSVCCVEYFGVYSAGGDTMKDF